MCPFHEHWLLLYRDFIFKCGKLGNWVFSFCCSIYSYGVTLVTSYGWRFSSCGRCSYRGRGHWWGWVCNRILVAIWGLPSSFADTDSELNVQKRLKTKRQRESYNNPFSVGEPKAGSPWNRLAGVFYWPLTSSPYPFGTVEITIPKPSLSFFSQRLLGMRSQHPREPTFPVLFLPCPNFLQIEGHLLRLRHILRYAGCGG